MKKALQIVSTIVKAAVIVFALLLLIPRLLGWEQYTVLTGSMEPNLPVGSLILVRPAHRADIAPGDVITFQSSDGESIVTHRAVEVTEDSVITKGDANDVRDAKPVPFDQIRGKVVFSIPFLGNLSQFLAQPGALVAVMGVLLGIILLLRLLPRLIKEP